MPRIAILCLCAALCWGPMPWHTAVAQEAAGATSAPETPASNVTLTQVSELAASTEKLLLQVRQLVSQPVEFEELKDKQAFARKRMQAVREETQAMMDDPNSTLDHVEANRNVWRAVTDMLAKEHQSVKDRAQALESSIADAARQEQSWEQVRQQIGDAPELADVARQCRRAITDLGIARKQLGVTLQETLALSQQWQELADVAGEMQLSLQQHEIDFRKNLLTSFQEPLWQMTAEHFRINDGARKLFELQTRLAWHYLREQHPFRPLALLLTSMAILVFLWRLRVQRARAEEGQMGLGLRLPLIDRPFSTTVATTVAVALLLFHDQPKLMQTSLAFLLFIPAVRLGLSRLATITRPLAWMVSILFLTSSLSVLTEAIPGVHRLWILACAIANLFAYLVTLRRLSADPDHDGIGWKALRVALRVAAGISAFSIVAEITGAAALAQFLITGLANAAYAGLCMVVVAGILSDLGVAAIYMPTSTSSQLVSRNRPLLVGRIGKLATLVCGLGWLHFTLAQFTLAEPLWLSVRALLNSELAVGNLAISLGDVLAVLVTLWLSYKISQLLRFIFLEDIAPRAQLARGVPEAIGTLMHYVVILIGFMMAISAAGIDMSKLALMAGALGVGIGIGLQDVVNNFTSGLILLFEQHIKQQDIIQCSTVNGQVMHIGLRSSVVRTFDGAEVIVPNSQLVSAQVINWTHSDQERRITIPVGVAYGSDPEQVINALLAVAREEPEVLADPVPTAFFLRFGPSSMDFELRAWIRSGELLLDVTSNLCSGIVRAFKAEGIEIPFPQQDVYLHNGPKETGNSRIPPAGRSSA